ncbi:beta-propeller fold lactonase family protein [Xanthomonadaceae bacterium JHOS43]|nr:beta-propeller fold lactonase family protein [Xanthomonadaceae bacterium JHOS43]
MTTQPSRSHSRSFSFNRHACRVLLALAALVPATALAAPTLSIQFDPVPADNYTPGGTASVTVVLSNGSAEGTTAAADVAATLAALPTGVTIQSSSRSCAASGADSECGNVDTGDGLYSGGSIGVGGSLTITATLNFALNATGDKQITVTGSADGVTSVTDNHSFSRTPVTDLAVSATAVVTSSPAGNCPSNATTYTPGCVSTYTVVVDNNGPDDANGARLSMSRTEGTAEGISRVCTASGGAVCPAASGGGAMNNDQIATFPAGGKLTYTVTVLHATTDTYAGAGISASIALPDSPAGLIDRDTGNNSASSTARTRNSAANLSATVTPTTIASPATHCPGGTTVYTPGCASAYTVEILNAGPDAATGASVSMSRLEASNAGFSWTCTATGGVTCPAASGLEPLSEAAIATFPKDGKLTYTITVTHASPELYASAGIIALVTAPATPIDINPGNNEASASRSIDRRAALRVVKRAVQNGSPVTSVPANVAFDYEITVYNDGPSDVGNSGSDPANPQIDASGPALVLNDTFDTRLEGVSGACIPSGGNPCWTLCPSTLRWSGDGGEPASATNCPVEAVVGSGSQIAQRFSLRAGSSSRLFTRVNVPEVSGIVTVDNTASVVMSTCGGAPDCHQVNLVGDGAQRTSMASVEVSPSAMAALDVANVGGGSAVPGTTHSYTVTVTNSGFMRLDGTAIQGSFPLATAGNLDGFLPGTVSWQCEAFNNACCSSTSNECGLGEPTQPVTANTLAAAVNLPANSWVEITLTGTIDPRAQADVALSASVTAPGVDDPIAASANTTLTPQRQLTLSKRLYQRDDEGANPRFFYEIIASNNGPSFAPGASLIDDETTVGDESFDFSMAEWSCQAHPAPAPMVAPEATRCRVAPSIPALPPNTGNGAINSGDLLLDLMPGGRAVVRLEVNTTDEATSPVVNTAELSLSGSNTVTASASASLSSTYTLKASKGDGVDVAHPGAAHLYEITVVNEGPDDAYDVHVRDAMPAALQNVQWTCAATSPVPGDIEKLGKAGDGGLPGRVLTVSGEGRHVYVLGADQAGHPVLYVFNRNATPGLDYGKVDLDPIDIEADGVNDPDDTGSVVNGMAGPVDLALSPDGAVLYVLSRDVATSQHNVTAFHRATNPLDPGYGQLSYAGTTATVMGFPRRIAVSATHIYVAGTASAAGAGSVEVFRPALANQVPVAVAASTVAAPSAAGPMALNAAATELFVASTDTSGIFRYAIAPASAGAGAGKLSKNAELGASVEHFAGIGDLVLAANGRDLYVHAANGTAPRIGSVRFTGEQVSSAVYGAGAAAVLSGNVRLALSPDGEHLIGVNPDANLLFTLRRNPITGTLSGVGDTGPDADFEQVLRRNGTPAVVELDVPTDVMVSPDNRHVLVASASIDGPIGPLAVFSRRAPPPRLGFIELDRQGDIIPDETQSTIDDLTAPTDVVVRGRHVYSISLADAAITMFERRSAQVGPEDEDGRHLTFKKVWRNGEGGIVNMTRPERLLLSPDGRSLFVTSLDGDSLVVFSRDTTSGELTFRQSFTRGQGGYPGGYPGLRGAHGLAMDSGSQYLYVAGSFEATIAIFSHDSSAAQPLTYQSSIAPGSGGATGLNGIRDLVVTQNGQQLLGVAATANTVLVFDRQSNGNLSFVQALNLGANQRPMALALSPSINNSDNAHVYVVAQNSHALHVLRRVLDTTSPQFGRVQQLVAINPSSGAPARMTGPRDVAVSADGKRVYVAAEFGASLVAFDRYDNATSSNYGRLALAETRSQDVDAVDGIAAPYAVAVSSDSRNVYVAGFDSNALASFSVGTGSMCSATGSGDIDDRVTIRAGGAVSYTVSATIRPDATGMLENTVEVEADGDSASASDTTTLLTSAKLEVSKTNNQIAVVPGTPVHYEVTVRNLGPGNVVGNLDDSSVASVTDLFGCTGTSGNYDCSASPFVPGSIAWTCSASGSGALDFIGAQRDGVAGVSGLAGISSLALIPAGDAAADPSAVRGTFLVGASVDDDALVFFRRDNLTGELSFHSRINHGGPASLEGARSVAVSADGRWLFVASRTSDSLNVFALSGSDSVPLEVEHQAEMRNPAIKGLDQALHVITLAGNGGGEHVYVAGSNDHAVAAFAYDGNALAHVGSYVNGQGAVLGLADVEYLVASPSGEHVYALSGSGASVAQFSRNKDTGALTYVARFTAGTLGVAMDGVSSATFDADGKYLYLTASAANRIVVLARVTDAGAGNFGSLSLASSIAQGEQGAQGLLTPRRVVLTADRQHLYVTSQTGSSIAWFSVHPQTGALAYLGIRNNRSAGVEGLSGATGLVLDPVLDQIYIAGTLDRAIAHFARQSDSWCPPNGTGLLDGVAVNIAAGGRITFQLDAQVRSELVGNLENVASVNWRSAGCGGLGGATLSECGSQATDTDIPSNLADLSITKDDGLAEFDGLSGATALAGDLRNVYVAGTGDNGIGMFQRQADASTGVGLRYLGALRAGQSGITGLAGVVDLLVSADGKHLYAASPVDNAVTAFARNAATGRLSQIDMEQDGLLGVSGLAGARALALSADGAHLYVAGGFSNAVAIFRRDNDSASANFGKLSFVTMVQAGVNGVSGIEAPLALKLSSTDDHLYVLGGAGDTLVAFSRQKNSGSGNFGRLEQIGRYQNATAGVLGMNQVRSLTLSADGAHVYVLGADAGTLVHFSRNAADGKLTFVPHSAEAAVLIVPDLSGATRLRLGIDGRLYAAAQAQSAILAFGLDAGGKPVLENVVRNGDEPADPSQTRVDGLSGVVDVALIEDVGGLILYAAATQDAALTVFTVDAGEPTYVGAIFDGMGGVAPGDTVTYTIVVSNHGPSDVLRARVVDAFPVEFEQVTWTCSGFAGGECPVGGSGNIDVEVKLPNGSHVQFAANGLVAAQAGGRLINTATVEAIGVLDPNMGNNSATDGDTVLSPAMDLSIMVDDNDCDTNDPDCEEVTQATPGGPVTYRVIAANAGPTYASGTLVGDTLPTSLYDVSWSCRATPEAGLLEELALAEANFDTGYRAMAIDTLGRHVYAVGTRTDAQGTRDTLVVLQRDPLTGVLTRLRSYSDGEVAPLPGGGGNAPAVRGIAGAVDVTITGDGRFVYVAGQAADAIAVFERDVDSGQLAWRSQVQDGEMGVDGIGGIATLALSPDGRHLYAGGASDHAIAGFSIHATTGALSQVSLIRQEQAGVNGLNGVSDLAFDASGALLFATATINRSVTAFRRASGNGVLSHLVGIEDGQVNVTASLLSPSALWVHEDRVFVADAQGDKVNLLRFVDDEEPGFELDEVIALDDDDVAFSQRPVALAFDPDQARLYVASAESGQLHLYSLLDEQARRVDSYDTTTSVALDQVVAVVFAPNLRQLYAATRGDGMIATLAREFGSRCPLSGRGALGTQRVDIGPGGFVSFQVAGRIFANATGSLSYSVSVDPRVLAFETQPTDNRATDTDTLVPAPDMETRKLRNTADEDVIAGLPVSYRIEAENHGVSDALGAWMTDDLPLFPTVAGGLVAGSGEWSCAANLPLAAGAHLGATLEPRIADLSALANSPDGRRWFGVSRSGNALVELRLDAAGEIESVHRYLDGDDAGGTAIVGLAGASHLAVSPDGAHLYVTAATSNSVLVFALGGNDPVFVQKLTSGSAGVAGLQGATHVVVSADGRFVYTAAVPSAAANSAIALFRRDAYSGELSFVERIQDGLGTFQPDSNVIRGVRKLHLSADGRQLYAIATVSQSLARFDVDANTGVLRYAGVLRGIGSTPLPALAGARDLVATPGDDQFYVLSNQGIALFARALNGSLALVSVTPASAAATPRALAMDTWGSRLYLADAQGAVHLYARQWSDGALEHRFTLPPVTTAEPGALLHLPPLGEVMLTQAGADAGLTRLIEQPVSRCMAEEGSESELPAQIDLGVSGSSLLHYAATVHPSARGILRNVARTVPGAGFDPNPDNDEGIDEATILVVSDLSISKTGPVTGVAGEYVDYVISVTNTGPSNALGIRVMDDLDPAKFRDASWTCAIEGEGDSVCHDISGTGPTLDAGADLHVGDVLKIALRVQVHPAFLGALENAAYVVPEDGAVDPTPDDHSAPPVVTDVVRRPDLSVSKTNGVAQSVAGEQVNYVITVANLGPSDAPEVLVQDFLPQQLHSASWTCIAQSGTGDCGLASGQGSINRTVSIPAGETLMWQLSATLRSSALGELSNTATAQVLGDAIDPDPANNSATDTDEIVTRADLSLAVTAPQAYDPASTQPMPYQVGVLNGGPSDASLTVVSIQFNHAVTHTTPSCTPAQGSQIACSIEAIPAGSTGSFTLGLRALPAAPSTLTGSLSVGSQTADPVPGNNTAASTTLLLAGVDIEATIDDGRIGLSPGDSTRYTIRIRNIGSVDAVDARVVVPIAVELVDAQWQCNAPSGAVCSASGTGDIDDLVVLPAGATLTYTLDATLDPAIDVLLHNIVEQTVTVEVDEGQIEVNEQNNADNDTNLIFKLIFRDGFEDPPAVLRGEPHAALDGIGALPVAMRVPSDDRMSWWCDGRRAA